MKKCLISLLLLSSSAIAGERYDHSGIYLGLGAQQTWIHNQIRTAVPYANFTCGHYAIGCGESINLNDASIAPFLGIQKEFSNNIVLGIEGKYDFLSSGQQKISPYANNDDTASVKIKNISTITAKFGYVFQATNPILDNALIYGKLGYASVKSDTDLQDLNGGHQMPGNTITQHGVTYGFGVEKPLGFVYKSLENALIGIEYSHINLNTKNNNAVDSLSGFEGVGVLSKSDIDALTLKLQYKFKVL
jgi:opacity protein-like surface antigen